MDASIFSAGGTGTEAAGLMIAGAVAGLAGGTLGLGGGVVLVPAVYLALRPSGMEAPGRLVMAVATALAASLPTALSLLHDHWKKGEIDGLRLRRRLPFVLVAAAAAAAILRFIPPPVAIAVVAATSVFLAVWLLFAKDHWRLALPTEGGAGSALQAGLGAWGAVSGIGAAILVAPYLKLSGISSARADGEAMAAESIVALGGASLLTILGLSAPVLPTYSLGFVNLAIFAVVAPVMFLAATFSHAYAQAPRTGALRKILALFIVIATTRMLFDWIG